MVLVVADEYFERDDCHGWNIDDVNENIDGFLLQSGVVVLYKIASKTVETKLLIISSGGLRHDGNRE